MFILVCLYRCHIERETGMECSNFLHYICVQGLYLNSVYIGACACACICESLQPHSRPVSTLINRLRHLDQQPIHGILITVTIKASVAMFSCCMADTGAATSALYPPVIN